MKQSHFVAVMAAALASGCDAARLPPPAPRTLSPPTQALSPVADVSAPPPAPPPAPPGASTRIAAGLSYTVVVTGAAAPSERLPMVVAMHGLGDSPEAFSELFQAFPQRARVIAVRGLDPFYGGFSWFPPGDADARPQAFQRAIDALAAALPELARQHPTCGLPVVTGFSQGAMLAYALAARSPSVVLGAVPVSGRLPRSFWPAPRAIGGLLPEVFGLHGTADDRIPVQSARETVARLRAVGFSATLREYPGARHTITADMQRDLYENLGRMLGPGC